MTACITKTNHQMRYSHNDIQHFRKCMEVITEWLQCQNPRVKPGAASSRFILYTQTIRINDDDDESDIKLNMVLGEIVGSLRAEQTR